MKRWLTSLLCISLLLGLAACGKDSLSDSISDTSHAAASTDSDLTESNRQHHTLVAYFSATGNTQRVAEVIAGETGGDIFEITPAVAYSDSDLNWSNAESRVSREHNDPNRSVPLATITAPNWEHYDTVYIGYPIWWGGAAFPTETFVKENDFTGKVVIPFCTSASSSLGNSDRELAALCGTGNWRTGQRFSPSADDSAIRKWIAAQ